VKGTRLCNLRCAYCHDWRDTPNQTMTFKVMARLISHALMDKEHDLVEFIWHGGEPTLLPISFYEKALIVQSHFRRSGQTVMNLIQTNGTGLTEAWAKFLHDNKFAVGISLDGPPEIHDYYRIYTSGKGSFDDVSKCIDMLRAYDIPFSVLMVIDEAGLKLGPKRIFDFFLKTRIKNFGLLAAAPLNQPNVDSYTDTVHYVNPERMNKFLIEMYDLWKQHGDSTIRIREIETVLQRMNGMSTYCTLGGHCFGHYYMIEPNGDVSHCELFVGDDRYKLGNIVEDDFRSLRNSTKLSKLITANENELKAMRTCDQFDICNGWCPHDRYLSVRHNPKHTSECCGLKEFITHVQKHMPDDMLQVTRHARYS
jgi:uncharacterized protein